MLSLKEKIIPFEGIESFRLGNTLDEVRDLLKREKISFNQSIIPNKGCTPELPWALIEILGSISMCFVENVLFEIVLENKYQGEIFNGIKLGMTMEEAIRIDPTIRYNEDDEDYISDNGYWLEIDAETDKIVSITVYVPEADDSSVFFTYEWVNKYKDISNGN